MGLLKKLTTRNKSKSTWDLVDGPTTRTTIHELRVPKDTARPSSFSFGSPPPPYELGIEPEISDSDLGSLLIGIDFGTT